MIAGMMRIKNEQRWIARVIEAQLPIVERLFIFDDHSTDETVAICRSFKEVTLFESEFNGVNEVRDKNFLLSKVEAEIPDQTWIVHIDGDEQIAPGGCELIRQLASKAAGPDAYRFQVVYLWDSERQVRVDGIYRDFSRPSMFRLRHGARFTSAVAGGFHCGNVPAPIHLARCGVRLLHYGYMSRADRIRKWNFYNSVDPKNPGEGYDAGYPERRSYPHIVQGDVPEVPANARLRHAGPLELRTV